MRLAERHVAVDRLVVIADAENREPGAGEQPEHEQMGRRQVLELIDKDDLGAGLGSQPNSWFLDEKLDRSIDRLLFAREIGRQRTRRRRGPLARY